jgi:hypothetical protein
MGNRDDNRSPRPRRVFDRDADMGGSGWSGASGRGGIHVRQPGGHPDYRSHLRDEQPRPFMRDERGYGYYGSGRDEGRYGGAQYREEGGFVREQGFGHVPGQRWGGGYGGDRDREEAEHRERHFGNEVDRGGRMPGGEMTTGRGYWPGFYPEPVSHGPHDNTGYGFHGSDMGMGAPPDDNDRGPHYGKGPKGYKRSDERTHEDVCDAIAHQGHIDASDVEVKVENGIVTLSGTVAQRHHKRALEHLVEQCRGVDEVHNELRLKREEARPQTREEVAPETNRRGDGGEHKNGKSARS